MLTSDNELCSNQPTSAQVKKVARCKKSTVQLFISERKGGGVQKKKGGGHKELFNVDAFQAGTSPNWKHMLHQ